MTTPKESPASAGPAVERLIVAYDSPADRRLRRGGDEVLADVFPWP